VFSVRPPSVREWDSVKIELFDQDPYDVVFPYWTRLVAFSLVVQVMVADVVKGVPDDREEITGGMVSIVK